MLVLLGFRLPLSIHARRGLFVTRAKENVVPQRSYSHPVEKTTGVGADQTVILSTDGSACSYPKIVRLVTYVDPETNNRPDFLTNKVTLPTLPKE